MEAKDTVMSEEQIYDVFKGKAIFASSPEMGRLAEADLVAETQAEISFKAGIREVVEWIEGKSSLHQIVKDGVIIRKVSMQDDDWQAKLKEWGIEWNPPRSIR